MDFPIYRSLRKTGKITHNWDDQDLAKRVVKGIYDTSFKFWGADIAFGLVAQDIESAKTPITRDVLCMPPFDNTWSEWNPIRYDGGPEGSVALALVNQKEEGWTGFSFYMELGDIPTLLDCTASIFIGEDGHFDRLAYRQHTEDLVDRGYGVDDSFRIAANSAIVLTNFALSHCKNVDVVERLPPRHIQRQAKRNGQPIIKYHEIVIDPARSYATNETTASTENKPSRALHIARGHFAHYTEDKPLFGKYSGTFWVPAHVRGSAKNGEVKSTYKVKSSKDQAA